MNEIEETWSPEPVKAWRYFWVGPLTWNWSDDRWEVMLRGDVEEWSGPVKYAGQHREEDYRNETEPTMIDHASPHTGCMCGINAVKELNSHEIRHRMGMWCSCRMAAFGTLALGSVGKDEERAIAVSPVELAGVVDEYEEGYRAQQATIVGPLTVFNCTPKQAAVLAQNYGVEVEQNWYPLLSKLEWEEQRKVQDGHRKADTSDHRGTGTSQDPRAGKRTSEGWRKVKDALAAVAFIFTVMAAILALGFGIYALSEWTGGKTDDAQCLALAAETGGVASEVGTFNVCQVTFANGLSVSGDGIYGTLPKTSAK